MSISVTPIASVSQVNSYNAIAPLMFALYSSNNSLPKTSLPTEIPGTIQAQASLLPSVSIYTDHGRLASNRGPGTLLGYA